MTRMYASDELAWDGDDLRLGRGRKLVSIVQDEKYPQMWRVRRPDGTLTDMVNRTRAKDAAIAYGLAILNRQGKAHGDAAVR